LDYNFYDNQLTSIIWHGTRELTKNLLGLTPERFFNDLEAFAMNPELVKATWLLNHLWCHKSLIVDNQNLHAIIISMINEQRILDLDPRHVTPQRGQLVEDISGFRIRPVDIDTSRPLWNAYGNMQTETSAS
jgi:hypothetical protein